MSAITPRTDWAAVFNFRAAIDGNTAASNALAVVTREADFQRRLEDLPQELYDMIQDFTFRAHIASAGPQDCDVAQCASIVRHVSQLKILQLNRVTRARYAEDFYRLRTFTVRTTELAPLEQCISSIPTAHRSFIGGFLCLLFYPNGPPHLLDQAMKEREFLQGLTRVRYRFGDELAAKTRFRATRAMKI